MENLNDYTIIFSVYAKVNPNDLKIALDSIINQSLKPQEIILVKDGPLNVELEMLIDALHDNQIKVTILSLENNQGAGKAYNYALSKCTTTYAGIMDSDDIAHIDKCKIQMEYLKEHPDVDIIATSAVEFLNSPDNIISYRHMPTSHTEILKMAKGRCPIIQPTALFKVQSVLDSGGYQHSPLTEDYDLYIRMLINNSKFESIDQILYYIRTSDDFFKRRGGIKYLKKILKFKKKWRKLRFYTFFEYLKTCSASIVSALVPNFIRTFIYKTFLRK